MKYAMVAINYKEDENNNLLIRRVLIEYKNYNNYKFTGTRLVEKDKYFYDNKGTHKYQFDNSGYLIIDSDDIMHTLTLKDVKRGYHYNKAISSNSLFGNKAEPILIEAKTDLEAIKQFNSRPELR